MDIVLGIFKLLERQILINNSVYFILRFNSVMPKTHAPLHEQR